MKRSAFVWETNGRKVYVCPKCNTRLESMKSREAFNPAKPFVFPPIVQRPKPHGIGVLAVGLIVAAVIAIILVSNVQSPTESASNKDFNARDAKSTGSILLPTAPETNTSTFTAATRPIEQGSSTALKDTSHFPVIIVISKETNVITPSGGFGMDTGEEVTVLSKLGPDAYMISHEGQQFSVPAKLIDKMKIK